jgi:hypothetical protein
MFFALLGVLAQAWLIMLIAGPFLFIAAHTHIQFRRPFIWFGTELDKPDTTR